MRKPSPSSPPSEKTACSAIEFYCAKDYVPEESVGFMIRRVLATVAQEVERQLEASDLTNAQWVPLLKLFMRQTSTVAELARECHLDAGAMTRLLDRLETKGLCRRVRSVEDRRVVNIELTDEGRDAAKGIPGVLCQIQNAHLAGFSVEEFQTLKGFLHRILNNAQVQSQSPIQPNSIPAHPIPGGPHEA
ncbi:MarR family winged helix-turn-helix transcriptional regulator [Rhodoferax sp. UBA5149]|uniref:MarR family winged helix-turn-helix transcriptional regulator n=1 Tax=Rhodoferax sp. UBA5149 TaxID=1947379 RepID=UPI0025FFC244|nr:MarR family transcriptional regulator [Rhodoferax sp. UBA5149]